jgi:TPR repeat protein
MGKFTLGTWLVQGRGGLTVDTKRAFELQCEAGQAGFPGAMFNAGCHLMSGQGCEVDEALAAQWFQRAADVGNLPQACINLGNMYQEGRGVEQDLQKARVLYARNSMTHAASRQALLALEAQLRATPAPPPPS